MNGYVNTEMGDVRITQKFSAWCEVSCPGNGGCGTAALFWEVLADAEHECLGDEPCQIGSSLSLHLL